MIGCVDGCRKTKQSLRLFPVALGWFVFTIFWLGFLSPVAADIPDGDETNGAWSELGDWPLVAIHAAVLDDGKVLSYTGTNDTLLIDVWDPSAGLGPSSHATSNNPLGTNLFCSFSLDDPNGEGKLLVGGETAGAQAPNFVARFDDGALSNFDSMNNPRWYPTVTTLWDGRLLAQGGTPNNFDGRFDPTTVAEVYETGQGWRTLEGTRDPGVWDTENYGWWYPKSYVTPAGKVWNLAWDRMYYIDPDGNGSVDEIGTFSGTNRGGSSASVMFDTGRVLQVGGGERGSDDTRFAGSRQATIFDLNYDPPLVIPAAPMNFGRHWADAVVLPDGRVLVSGGSEVNNTLEGVALNPEIWDPVANTWTVVAQNSTPRLYHSTTLLLPDASVLTAGGGKSGPVDNFNGEVYYPPYLYDDSAVNTTEAFRPWFESVPRTISYGQSFTVTARSPGRGGPVDRVTFVKQGNSTHSMNTQIFQELSFTRSGDQLTIDAPDFATVATPGEYLLFVLDASGVPSVARTVRLGGTGLTPPEPLDPPDPGETGTITGVVSRDGAGGAGGVSVDLFTQASGGGRDQYLTSVTTDNAGNYAFRELDVGCYEVTFIAPDGERFVDNSQYLTAGTCIEAVETDTLNATLRAQSGDQTAISGTVTMGDGSPVDAIGVDLFLANGDGSRGQYLRSDRTDSAGEYGFDVESGCYIVTFIAGSGDTFTNGSRWFSAGQCPASGETAVINATLVSDGPEISGEVTRQGQPAGVPGVTVDLFSANADGSRGQWLTSMTTDQQGHYRFASVNPGCYVLTFIAPSGQTFTNGSQWFQAGICVSSSDGPPINAVLN